ncbi:hypothetical protein CRV08_03565 [Halarcobacter ebronensis]|uniref:SPOR domain-containing protein n=1 Tax=Halarcobacter ebronensis TaxID=1462615 RepID=A0A4Q0YGN7_9BACT|nr:TolC family protein [Halarcobacter ebronensis]RXJ69797.1 hypothetical protein CRV08_03565 [Halarcobacter ebronensis]
MKNLSMKLSIPAILLLSVSSLEANTIKEVVELTMSNNPKISSVLKNNEGYRLYIDEARGNFLPTLDLTAYVGAKQTKRDPNVGNKSDVSTEGFNAQVDFEQVIYDNSLFGAVDQAEYRFTSNQFYNQSIVSDILYDSIDSYLNLVKYKNRLVVAENSLSIYDTYLVTAKETQDITGETLQKAEVNSKIHYAKNMLHEDVNNKLRAISSFKKNVGVDPDGKSCRPNLDESKIPNSLKGLIDLAIKTSPSILEQIENIKEQRAVLNQSEANFLPTLKFKAQGIYDDDLLNQNEVTEVYSARIELSYNIFNGTKDKTAAQRERIFLEEAQKTLDTVTKDVVDNVTAAYNSYQAAKKRIKELESYIVDNKDILVGYKNQFEAGTRTFIDVLNVERDLVSARKEIIDVEYELDSKYFEIFKYLGNLEEAVLSSNNDVCTDSKPIVQKKEVKKEDVASEEIQQMLSDETPKKPKVEEKNKKPEAKIEKPEASLTTNYALYLVSYKDTNSAKIDIEKAKELLGDSYKIKLEESKGYTSVVVYKLPTKDSLDKVVQLTKNEFPYSYMMKYASK